jgi:glycosyltransferase involved in cell wall biosynthesis
MKIKIILFESYRGLVSGWATRYVGIIKELVKTHDVYLFAPGDTSLLKEHFGSAFVCKPTCDTYRVQFTAIKYLRSLILPKKEQIFLPGFNYNREFHTIITNDKNHYDYVIYFNLSAFIQYKCHDVKTPAVCDLCDSLYRHFTSSLKNSTTAKKRVVTMLDMFYLCRVKRKYVPRDLSIITITDIDSMYVKKILKRNRIITIPNGVNLPAISIDDQYIDAKKKSTMILFFGSLDYQPNKDSVAYILDHLWPEIVKKYPDLQLVIAGRNPDQSLITRCRDITNGKLYADVADPMNLYSKARFTLLPIHSGGGMKNKILESFACGTPVITTPEGAIGISMEHKVHGFIKNTMKDLLNGVDFFMAMDLMNYKKTVYACRALAERYSWEQAGQRLFQKA